jgi:hypothetical protein
MSDFHLVSRFRVALLAGSVLVMPQAVLAQANDPAPTNEAPANESADDVILVTGRSI